MEKEANKKGPCLIAGDFNARVGTVEDDERDIFGSYAFDADRWQPPMETEVADNRHRFASWLTGSVRQASNTYYRKSPEKLATYRALGTQSQHKPVQRPAYEQIDYITIPNRWKNCIQNCEANHQPNIASDHYPVECTFRAKLEKQKKMADRRTHKYAYRARRKWQASTALWKK